MEFINSIGYLDIVFIAVFSISIIIGLIRGVVREITSIIGLVISVFLAFKFSPWLSTKYVSKAFPDYQALSYAFSFATILLISLLAFALINLLISQVLKFSGLNILNRILGGVFGLLRGAVLSMVFVFVAGFFPFIVNTNWWKKSEIAPVITNLTNTTLEFVPSSMKESIEKVVAINNSSSKKNKNTNNANKVEDIQDSIKETVDTYNKTIELLDTNNDSKTSTDEKVKEILKSIDKRDKIILELESTKK